MKWRLFELVNKKMYHTGPYRKFLSLQVEVGWGEGGGGRREAGGGRGMGVEEKYKMIKNIRNQ